MHVNMYRLECRGERQEQASVAERSSDKLNVWHQSMAHLRGRRAGRIRWPDKNDGFRRDVDRCQCISNRKARLFCEACAEGNCTVHP